MQRTLAGLLLVWIGTAALAAQSADVPAAAAAIMQADRDFNQSVADRNRERFLGFLAETATFGGGTANEVRGRTAVMNDWDDFFQENGPTLTWAPTGAQVNAAGDLGATTGTSVLRVKNADGTLRERRGAYLTVWRKQTDGTWKVIFDSGSSLP